MLIPCAARALEATCNLPRPSARWLARALAVALIGFLLGREIPFYRLTPEEWSRRKYGEDFVATKRMSRELAAILRDDETFYTWGDETGLYFYTRQSPPSGLIHIDGMLEGPLVDPLVTRSLAQLTARPPDLFLVETNFIWMSEGVSNIWMDARVFEWFSSRYRECPVNPNRDGFILFVCRDSDLETRMGKTE